MSRKSNKTQSEERALERFTWMEAVLAINKIKMPHAAARLAITIALHRNNDTGRCDPSYQRLAVKSALSKRSVRAALAGIS